MLYQWLRCDTSSSKGTPITGATSDRYMPTTDDLGKYLNVTLVSADVNTDTTVTVTSMVFDAQGYATRTEAATILQRLYDNVLNK